MSNHNVLCQANVSLYLQFLNCASKNCLVLILFSQSPLPSFYTQQSQTNVALFLHMISTSSNAWSQGSSSRNTIVLFLESLTLNGKTSPGCLFKYLKHQLFSSPVKREKNHQELRDFSNILKTEFHCMRHHCIMAKNPKTQTAANKTSSTEGVLFSRAITCSSGQT